MMRFNMRLSVVGTVSLNSKFEFKTIIPMLMTDSSTKYQQ